MGGRFASAVYAYAYGRCADANQDAHASAWFNSYTYAYTANRADTDTDDYEDANSDANACFWPASDLELDGVLSDRRRWRL